MSNLKISVITVSFNSAATIERTIDSVVNQRCPNMEYIVVDGGSLDGTVEIIEKYSRLGQITKYVSERDEGISNAFNKGIALSSGDVIGIINADDYYMAGTLNKVMQIYNAPKMNFILHGNILQEKRGRRSRMRPRPLPQIWKYVDCPFNHPAVFVPRIVYNQIGVYDKRYRYAMDYDFYLRAMIADIPFVFVDDDFAIFSTEGISCQSPQACHREVLKSQIENGLFAPTCYLVFMLKMLVNRAKRLIRPNE